MLKIIQIIQNCEQVVLFSNVSYVQSKKCSRSIVMIMARDCGPSHPQKSLDFQICFLKILK